MRTQEERICWNKGNLLHVYLLVFSSDTMVESKRKAEKSEVHSGSWGFYHNERYTERLKKNKI